MASPSSTTELLDLVRKSGIYRTENLDDRLQAVAGLSGDPVQSAAVLVQHGLLTRFQAKLLLTGRYKGFRLGSYVIKEQLGQGGMGAVYLAEHETLRRRVALKVLTPPKDNAQGRLTIERFLREARAAAALDHPNIVRIHDVANQGDVHYLVMEFVDGQTLDGMLEKGGPITPSRAVGYIAQAAAGLQHAHEKGFVHRDIKPANLILAKDGTVKILDMGLARSFTAEADKLTEVMDQGAILGTADFISPEQAMNAPGIDIRADIYSLGATFFALVTGKPPFSGNTTQKLIQHQMKDAPSLTDLDRTFPPELAQVAAKMLHKKPEKRYQTPAEVITGLAPWLSDDGGTKVMAGLSGTDLANTGELKNALTDLVGGTKRVGASRRFAAGKPGPNKALWAGVGTAVLVAVGVVGYALFGGGGSTEAKNPGVAGNPNAPAYPAAPPPKSQTKQTSAPPRPVAAATAARPAPAAAGVFYRSDFSALKPAKTEVRGKTKHGSTVGNEALPDGWYVNHYRDTADADYLIEDAGGAKALGIRYVGGTIGAQFGCKSDALFATVAPGETITLRLTYRFDGTGTPCAAVQQNVKPYKKHAVLELPPTGGAWRTTEFGFTRPDADPLAFIFNVGFAGAPANDEPAKGTILVKSLEARTGPPEKVLLDLGLWAQQPFVMRAKAPLDPAGGPRKLIVVSNTGDGKLPVNWYRWIESPDTEAEFFADRSADGRAAIGVRTIGGPGGVLLTSPEFPAPTGRCRVAVEYQTGPASSGAAVRFRPTKGDKKPTWELIALKPTNGAWVTETVEADMQGATAGLLELYNASPGAEAAVRFAAVTVTAAAVTDRILFQSDFSAVKPFTMRGRVVVRDPSNPRSKVWEQISKSGDGVVPKGWTARPHNPRSEVEYTASAEQGGMALGIRTVKSPGSGMLFMPDFDAPSGKVRLRFDYLTEGGTSKDFNLRFLQKKPENKAAWTVQQIDPTGGSWKTAEADVDLKGATGGLFEWHNNAGGSDVVFRLRSVTVVEPAEAPAAEPAAGRVLFALNLSRQQPFTDRGRGADPTDGIGPWRSEEKTGPGALPPGWLAFPWKAGTAAEFAAEAIDGQMALGMRHTAGEPTQMLFTPVFEGAPGRARLTFEYKCEFADRGGILVRFMPKQPVEKPAFDVQRVPGGGGAWQTAVIDADLRGSTAGLFEFHTAGGERDRWVWIRGVKVTDPAAPTAPVAAAPAAPAREVGPALYSFDAGALRPGRFTVENRQSSGESFFPEGFRGHCWKPESVAEFRCEAVAGSQAFGMTNFNDTLSAQTLAHLEGALGVALTEGKEYVVRVEYRTANDAEGKAVVREPGPSYRGIAEARLTRGGDGWKSAEVTFRKADGKKLELLFENTAVGEGNTLWVRKIEVAELK